MVLELMRADGAYRTVQAKPCAAANAGYTFDGAIFQKFREVAPGVVAYARTPPSEPFDECILPPLPMPLGKALLPAPVLWETMTGIGAFVTDEKRKVTLRGLFSSWEESDDEASEADDGALLEDDPVDSENDELAEDIETDDEEAPSEDEEQLQED